MEYHPVTHINLHSDSLSLLNNTSCKEIKFMCGLKTPSLNCIVSANGLLRGYQQKWILKNPKFVPSFEWTSHTHDCLCSSWMITSCMVFQTCISCGDQNDVPLSHPRVSPLPTPVSSDSQSYTAGSWFCILYMTAWSWAVAIRMMMLKIIF